MSGEPNKLAGAPAGFRAFVRHRLAQVKAWDTSDDPTCADVDAEVDVSKLRTDGYAAGSVFNCGGNEELWVDDDGNWKTVSGTQEGWYPCTELHKYTIPSRIAGDQCSKGTKFVPYKQH
jgi:hypothetical protein